MKQLKKTPFIKGYFQINSKTFKRIKIKRGVESISQMKLHIAQQTPAPSSQAPASSKAKAQSRQKKAKITVPVSCLLLITCYRAKQSGKTTFSGGEKKQEEKINMYICLCIYLCMMDLSLDTFIQVHKIL